MQNGSCSIMIRDFLMKNMNQSLKKEKESSTRNATDREGFIQAHSLGEQSPFFQSIDFLEKNI